MLLFLTTVRFLPIGVLILAIDVQVEIESLRPMFILNTGSWATASLQKTCTLNMRLLIPIPFHTR